MMSILLINISGFYECLDSDERERALHKKSRIKNVIVYRKLYLENHKKC